MDPQVAEKLADWLRWDKNPTTLAEIQSLADASDTATLRQRLCGRLTFGTAGLRGVMCAGFAAMNDLVIIQTAQGLCAHVRATYPLESDRQRGICIGYDGRHNSYRFAQLTAVTFTRAGMPVHLFGSMVATPFVPYGIRKLGCLAGVMVTASHNPKEDNGYKVYWSNGAQIIGPHDKAIENSIKANLRPKAGAWDLDWLRTCRLLRDDSLPGLSRWYNEALTDAIPAHLQETNRHNESRLQFVYTAMHGVGYPYVRDAFEAVGLQPVLAVPEQRDADPDFPTVRFPNPEEGASALELSMRLAEQSGSDVILANDPDADRLAFAERSAQTGKWKVFTGNELGAVLGWWALQVAKWTEEKIPAPENYVMLCSTVSSMVLRAVAAKEGFVFEDTLTGFKWMGNRAVELRKQGMRVLFAFEEAIGFMFGTEVLDKDGVSAAVHLATMATWLRSPDGGGQTVAQKLQEVYLEYGFHCTENSYYICHEKEVIDRIFERIRGWDGVEGKYPSTICDGKYHIKSVRDLTTGHDSTQPDGKAVLPTSRSSHMITFAFANGVMLTLRTSGTEPKVKYYSEMCATPEERDWDLLRETLHTMVVEVVDELLQPKLNKLIARD